jgi:ribosomal protein S18 acetylase RimI-like enzyme
MVYPVLRPADANDAVYIIRLCEATMRGYVEQVWGKWNGEAAEAELGRLAASGAFSLIYIDQSRVGAIIVSRHDEHHELEQLFIEPAHQRQGIGSAVISLVVASARDAGKPLRLSVLAGNPARSLYERLGFRLVASTKERDFMELAA